jgi:antitoxin component YwqK of YwqJK toxin-antitoxin module
MKSSLSIFVIIMIFSLTSGCFNSGKGKAEKIQADTSTVADTGFTGITQYRSGNFISYEVTFKNGVKNGLMKTFYPSGKVRTTFWYENGLMEDTAVWYWEDGKVFRKTPFKNDSINGVQIQYWSSGKVKARLEYINGLRKPYIEEFTSDGKKITGYPELVVTTKDEYNRTAYTGFRLH